MMTGTVTAVTRMWRGAPLRDPPGPALRPPGRLCESLGCGRPRRAGEARTSGPARTQDAMMPATPAAALNTVCRGVWVGVTGRSQVFGKVIMMPGLGPAFQAGRARGATQACQWLPRHSAR
jgi:hypothetical protein